IHGRIVDRNVYPGIDLVYYQNGREIEFDFSVSPGADYRSIALKVDEDALIHASPEGDLVLTKEGEAKVALKKPATYQDNDGIRREIPSHYEVDNGAIRLVVGTYNHSLPPIVDPVLTYSTYFPVRYYSLSGVATDGQGNTYVAGSDLSDDVCRVPFQNGF